MESSFVMFLFFFSGLSLAQPMVQLKAVTQKLRAFVSPSLGSSLSSANSCPKLPDIGCTLISSQRIKPKDDLIKKFIKMKTNLNFQ